MACREDLRNHRAAWKREDNACQGSVQGEQFPWDSLGDTRTGPWPDSYEDKTVGNHVVFRPSDAEETFDGIEMMSEWAALIIVDDVQYLARKQEFDDPGFTAKSHREFASELKYLKSALRRTESTVVFTGPVRKTLRPPFRGTGISENSSARIELVIDRRKQDKTTFVNVTSRSFDDVVPLVIKPGTGISRSHELLELGTENGLIQKRDSWYSFQSWWPGNVSFQGKEEVLHGLETTPNMSRTLEKKIYELYDLESE